MMVHVRSSIHSMLVCTLLAGALLAGLALPGTAHADEAALQQLQAQLAPLQSMRARFQQTVRDETGAVLQRSEGTMAVKRGNRLRWRITSPYAYLIVTDGMVLWRYDEDLEQATRQPFSGELADTPALIFSSDGDRIGDYYRVSRVRDEGGDWYRLEPHRTGSLFQSLRLRFERGAVAELQLVDNLDQRTDIRFTEVEINPSLDDALFHFDPPPTVDVIRDEP